MKKLASAILAAFVLGIGSQGVVSAAAPLDLVQNGPVFVMLDDSTDDEVEEVAPAATEQAEEDACKIEHVISHDTYVAICKHVNEKSDIKIDNYEDE